MLLALLAENHGYEVRISVIINRAPVSYLDYKYDQFFILNIRQYYVIAYSVSPLSGSVGGESLPMNTRVFTVNQRFNSIT